MNKFQPGKLKGKEQDVIAVYLSGKPTRHVAKQFGVTKGAILHCLKIRNIPRRVDALHGPIKTHCPQGHPRSSENVDSSGHCRICVRNKNFRRSGSSVEERAIKFENQRGLCAICHKFMTCPQSDHDHDTNQVRDLLCNRCNRGIGYLLDSVIVVESALAYLKKWKEQES